LSSYPAEASVSQEIQVSQPMMNVKQSKFNCHIVTFTLKKKTTSILTEGMIKLTRQQRFSILRYVLKRSTSMKLFDFQHKNHDQNDI